MNLRISISAQYLPDLTLLRKKDKEEATLQTNHGGSLKFSIDQKIRQVRPAFKMIKDSSETVKGSFLTGDSISSKDAISEARSNHS